MQISFFTGLRKLTLYEYIRSVIKDRANLAKAINEHDPVTLPCTRQLAGRRAAYILSPSYTLITVTTSEILTIFKFTNCDGVNGSAFSEPHRNASGSGLNSLLSRSISVGRREEYVVQCLVYGSASRSSRVAE